MTGRVPAHAGAATDSGEWMLDLATELFPICRSITGDGVRRTLAIIDRELALDVHEVPSGTQVLDWTVPPEWNIRDAYVADSSGRRAIDFQRLNLHVVGYSAPVNTRMSREELLPHLHSLPDQADLVPYRTTYFEPTWGFCVSQLQLEGLDDGVYTVVIDSTLTDGSLTYAECVLLGDEPGEVLISCHICHPSLANDNLSGIAVVTALGRALANRHRRLTYRLLFAPGTIGAITWLAGNRDAVRRVRHGVVVAGVGDRGAPTYKRSRRGTAAVDRAFAHVLSSRGRADGLLDFSPWGYDERQYGSPGFDLPVGRFSRTPHGTYREYHTSGDDLSFVDAGALEDSLEILLDVIAVLEGDRRYRSLRPYGEPQLGRRGLYAHLGGQTRQGDAKLALLWVLNLSDGGHTLLDVTERSGLPFAAVQDAAAALTHAGLLVDTDNAVPDDA